MRIDEDEYGILRRSAVRPPRRTLWVEWSKGAAVGMAAATLAFLGWAVLDALVGWLDVRDAWLLLLCIGAASGGAYASRRRVSDDS